MPRRSSTVCLCMPHNGMPGHVDTMTGWCPGMASQLPILSAAAVRQCRLPHLPQVPYGTQPQHVKQWCGAARQAGAPLYSRQPTQRGETEQCSVPRLRSTRDKQPPACLFTVHQLSLPCLTFLIPKTGSKSMPTRLPRLCVLSR